MNKINLLIETQNLAASILYKNYPVAKTIAKNPPQVYLVENVFVDAPKNTYGIAVWAVRVADYKYGAILINSGIRTSSNINNAVFLSFTEDNIIKKFEVGDFVNPFIRLEDTPAGLLKFSSLVRTTNSIDALKILQKSFKKQNIKLDEICLLIRFFKKGKRYCWAAIKNGLVYAVNINGKGAFTFSEKEVFKVFRPKERVNRDYRLKEKKGILYLGRTVSNK